jgi:hypothetical protein
VVPTSDPHLRSSSPRRNSRGQNPSPNKFQPCAPPSSLSPLPVDATTLAKRFKSAKADRIEDILETLASLGQARALKGGKFAAV